MPTPNNEVNTEDAQVLKVRAFLEVENNKQFLLKQQMLLDKLPRLKTKSLERGLAVDFGGLYGVQHVQMRDGDRANMLGLRIQAEMLIANGLPNMMGIRTSENVWVPLSPEDTLDLSWKILSGYVGTMQLAWDFEDMVRSALTLSDLPDLPEFFALPVTETLSVSKGQSANTP